MKKHFTKGWFAIVLINLVGTVLQINSVERRTTDEYSFILLMPQADTNLLCAVFRLDDLRVCRFPNGPMWSNSLALQDLHVISEEIYLEIKKHAQKLHILCLDYHSFKIRCQNNCQQNICGFALPWEPGMAYVFDDLKDVDQVTGFLIEKSQLAQLQINNVIKKNELFTINTADTGNSLDLDEIDLLIAGNTDSEYVGKYLPYPLQELKNFCGKVMICCLMRYHEIRQKMIQLMGKYYARSET